MRSAPYRETVGPTFANTPRTIRTAAIASMCGQNTRATS